MKKKDKLALIRQYYPNANTTSDTIEWIVDFIEEELDIEAKHVMLADSICSDDVNSIQYPQAANEFLGPFKMGGLDGFPFTGLTGMSAFASHVPNNGAVFIYYGPHIGVSANGSLGEICRYGQDIRSSCCGAAKGALDNLKKGKISEGKVHDLDYQMNTIEQILYRQKERVLSARLPMYEATEVIYEAIDAQIQELVAQTAYLCQYLILMGGILINGDIGVGSFHDTRRLDLLNLKTGERQDLRVREMT